MRWKVNNPNDGELRRRSGFLLFPRKLRCSIDSDGLEWCWLEKAVWVERYSVIRWRPVCWLYEDTEEAFDAFIQKLYDCARLDL